MSGIVVSIDKPTERGRLYPRYNDAAGILAAESRVERAWLYGVDIDGRIVFDLDDERRLANFDLHIPKGRWKQAHGLNAPFVVGAADLIFSEQAIAVKSFNLTIEVRHDEHGMVQILFGSATPERAYSLSDSCLALLNDRELVGFVISGL